MQQVRKLFKFSSEYRSSFSSSSSFSALPWSLPPDPFVFVVWFSIFAKGRVRIFVGFVRPGSSYRERRQFQWGIVRSFRPFTIPIYFDRGNVSFGWVWATTRMVNRTGFDQLLSWSTPDRIFGVVLLVGRSRSGFWKWFCYNFEKCARRAVPFWHIIWSKNESKADGPRRQDISKILPIGNWRTLSFLSNLKKGVIWFFPKWPTTQMLCHARVDQLRDRILKMVLLQF